MTTTETPELRCISALETRPLRQAVLRPHQALEELAFPGDDAPDTAHLGLYLEGKLIGIVSLYREAMPGCEDFSVAWRLRGMAVEPTYRNRGYGAILLQACYAQIQQHALTQASNGPVLFWCTARITARDFYERHGFQIRGEAFPLPDIGMHYYMFRMIDPAAKAAPGVA